MDASNSITNELHCFSELMNGVQLYCDKIKTFCESAATTTDTTGTTTFTSKGTTISTVTYPEATTDN